jgi:hypothetical protein
MGMLECSITRTLTRKGLSQKEAEDPAALLRSHVDAYFGPPKRSAGTACRFGRLSA